MGADIYMFIEHKNPVTNKWNLVKNSKWSHNMVPIRSPAINVVEKDNEYDVEYAAPGMTKDDFKVSLDEEQNLVVELTKKEESTTDDKENKSKKGVYLRREFSYSNFQQKMILPDDVDHEKISASVENGVLTVVLPKKNAEEQKKEVKMIDIK